MAKAHRYVYSKALGWGYCAYCGEVPLKNKASIKAWNAPCPGAAPDPPKK